MGVSTDAIVAFGFDLGEELPGAFRREGEGGEESSSFDWDEFVTASLNLPEPQHQDYKVDWPEYWEAKRKAVAAFPLTLVSHCSYDYPMYFLAVNGTGQTARRGYPAKLERKEISAAQVQAMRDFCEKWGIEWQEPDWHIFSMWG